MDAARHILIGNRWPAVRAVPATPAVPAGERGRGGGGGRGTGHHGGPPWRPGRTPRSGCCQPTSSSRSSHALSSPRQRPWGA